jgi:hypothetical protein
LQIYDSHAKDADYRIGENPRHLGQNDADCEARLAKVHALNVQSYREQNYLVGGRESTQEILPGQFLLETLEEQIKFLSAEFGFL